MWSAIKPPAMLAARIGALASATRLPSRAALYAYRLARPAAAASLPYSRSLATAASASKEKAQAPNKTKKTAAAKSTKKKNKKKPAKKTKTVKLADEYLGSDSELAAKKLNNMIRNRRTAKAASNRELKNQLKELSLLSTEPEKLPTKPQSVYFHRNVEKNTRMTGDSLKSLWEKYRNLSEEEMKSLEEEALRNKAANKAAKTAWVLQYTPKQIADANMARTRLLRLFETPKKWNGRPIRKIEDPRVPKRPLTPYILFVKQHLASTPNDGTQLSNERMKLAAEKYRTLSEDDLKVFHDTYKANMAEWLATKEALGLGKEALEAESESSH